MKKGLIIGGALALAGLSTGAYFLFRDKKPSGDSSETDEGSSEESGSGSGSSKGGGSQPGSRVIKAKIERDHLMNSFHDLKKVKLRAKKGGTNLRTSAEVDNTFPNNKLKAYDMGTYLGKVVSETQDNLTPPNRWFKIKLDKPVTTFTGVKNYGWVRDDVVTFRTTTLTAKSSFSGKLQRTVPDLDLVPIVRYKPVATGIILQGAGCEWELGQQVLDDF